MQFFGGRSKKKSNAKGIEKKRKMSGTVNYPKVIDQLTDVIKELNVGFAPCGAAAPSEETRRADAVGLLKALLSTLEQGPAAAAAAAAAAEHDATADKATEGDVGAEFSRQEYYAWKAEMERKAKLNNAMKAAQNGAFTGHGWRNNVKDL